MTSSKPQAMAGRLSGIGPWQVVLLYSEVPQRLGKSSTIYPFSRVCVCHVDYETHHLYCSLLCVWWI